MPKRVSIDEVIGLIKQGYSDSDIIAHLQESGYSPQDINDAMNQARIKIELAETAGEEYPTEEYAEASEAQAPAPAPAPAPQYAPQYYQYAQQPSQQQYAEAESPSVEAIEEIAEGVISEKWEEFRAKVGDIGEMKSYLESRINELNDRVKRLEASMDRLHVATLAKVDEQGRSVKALSSEVEALEGTLGKVMQPLVSSVKELRDITEKAKAKPKEIKKK